MQGKHVSQSKPKKRRGLVLEHKPADLRAVAVADDDLIALADYSGDVLRCRHDVPELVLTGRGLASCLKRISAESNNNFFHDLTVLLFLSARKK